MSRGLFATLFAAGEPFALLDTRERREYVNGHWFGSTNIPLSVLTPEIIRLVSGRDFPIHLLDWQDAASDAAARRLNALGFTNVTRYTTGLPDGFGDGFVKGEFVWSKAFGELVAHTSGLLEVTPADYLADYREARLFDVRPTSEYSQFTIPGSHSLPNSLLLENMSVLKRTSGMALLHCAGRTRSIIGACTLKAAGYSGAYAIFKGGTQAWQLDGLEREFHAARLFAEETDDVNPVRDFLDRWEISYTALDNVDLDSFVATHTQAYLFDVSDDAATGQRLEHNIVKTSATNLIQQTDRSIARYHIPVILFDHGSGSRGAFAAYWLQTMGIKVSMVYLQQRLACYSLQEQGLCAPDAPYEIFSTEQLLNLPVASVSKVDLRTSDAYMHGHIRGCPWGNISELLGRDVPVSGATVVIGDDVEHASQCADLLAEQGWQIAGIFGWNINDIDQGLLSATTIETPIDKSALFSGRHHGNVQDSIDYLAWEEALPDQIDPIVRKFWLQRIGNMAP